MEGNQTIHAEVTGSATSKDTEAKAERSTPTYDPDAYMYEHPDFDEMYYYLDRCFFCKHGPELDCDVPPGPCSYEPI